MLEANDNDREFQQDILNFADKYYNDFESKYKDIYIYIYRKYRA